MEYFKKYNQDKMKQSLVTVTRATNSDFLLQMFGNIDLQKLVYSSLKVISNILTTFDY